MSIFVDRPNISKSSQSNQESSWARRKRLDEDHFKTETSSNYAPKKSPLRQRVGMHNQPGPGLFSYLNDDIPKHSESGRNYREYDEKHYVGNRYAAHHNPYSPKKLSPSHYHRLESLDDPATTSYKRTFKITNESKHTVPHRYSDNPQHNQKHFQVGYNHVHDQISTNQVTYRKPGHVSQVDHPMPVGMTTSFVPIADERVTPSEIYYKTSRTDFSAQDRNKVFKDANASNVQRKTQYTSHVSLGSSNNYPGLRSSNQKDYQTFSYHPINKRSPHRM